MMLLGLCALFGASLAMRPELIKATELIQQGELLRNLSTAMSNGLVDLHEVERASGELVRRQGNATAHMTDKEAQLIRDIIKIIRESIYSSMTSSHNEEQREVADALERVDFCNIGTSNDLARTGVVGKLLDETKNIQNAYQQIDAEEKAFTATRDQKLSALNDHMSNAPRAPGSCSDLPQLDIPHWDVFFESNSYVTWFLGQQEAFKQKRDEHKQAELDLAAKSDLKTQVGAELSTEYCAFKLVLGTTCDTHDTCYETETMALDAIKERVKGTSEGRQRAFESGERAIAHLQFLLGAAESPDAGHVDSSRYQLSFADTPDKLACEIEQPSWEDFLATACVEAPGKPKEPNTQNLLVGKPVRLSSGPWSHYEGAYATDNVTMCNGFGALGVCGLAHTSHELNAFIQVDMEEERMLHRVTVWNGWDHCCRERINPFVVKLLDAKEEEVWKSDSLRMDPGIIHESMDIEVAPSKPVRFVRVQLDNHADYLHVAEIQAF